MNISVVLTTYNRANTFLPKAIESVINQTYKNWELIIVDDCSTDNTREVVSKYTNDSRVQYHRLSKNSGSDTKPKNEGTRKATGNYIIYLDDDVRLRKKALKKLLTLLRMNRAVDVAYGDMWISSHNQPGIARDFDAQFLMLRNFIDTSAALMKRKAILDVGGWDETLPKFVDWNLWVRMTKYGKKFKRLPEFTFDYYIHEDSKSNRVKTEMWNHPLLGELFVPTFDPSGCLIELPYLKKPHEPRVAIFSIHYDRLDYSKLTYQDMIKTSGYPFDWFCWDNGNGETFDWIEKKGVAKFCGTRKTNLGISEASNKLIRAIGEANYDITIKIDNDVEFFTHGWLKDIVDLWKRNHMIYVSPYVEGLKDNPGGAKRKGYGMVGGEYIEVTNHIGGIFAAISTKAYKDFEWKDQLLHGNQDVEASHAFRLNGYMPCYYPKHAICHRDTTVGQQKKYKKYFERRESEKTAT